MVGVVESAGSYDGAAKVKVDGVWFSNKFKPLPNGVEAGSTVKIEYQNNPNFKGQFWKRISVMAGGATNAAPASNSRSTVASKQKEFPVPYDSRSTSIVRQNALTNAIKYAEYRMASEVVREAYTVDEIIQTAMQFEEYTGGSLDVRVMKENSDDMTAVA